MLGQSFCGLDQEFSLVGPLLKLSYHPQEVALKSFRNQIIKQSPQMLWSSLASGKDEAAKGPRDISGF